MKGNSVVQILNHRYGVGALADWTAVTWAVAHAAKLHGVERAAADMKKLNRIREKHGAYTNIPDYGTDLFKAYFGRK